MAEQDLLALVKRLEAVALKLESSAGAGGAKGGAGSRSSRAGDRGWQQRRQVGKFWDW